MNAALEIKNLIKMQEPNTIFSASKLFKQSIYKKISITEANYYKVLERLKKDKKIIRVSKGMYAVPKNGYFGILPISENVIISSIIKNEEDGVEIGYFLYNKHRLTTQIPNKRLFYTNNIKQFQKQIGNVLFIKKNIVFNDNVKKVIEVLEILQNFRSIEDLDYSSFYMLMENYAKEYNEKVLFKVLEDINYKKSTLAFLRDILNYFKIKNNIEDILSKLSKYDIPKWR